jgi:hypothetical protein
VIVPENVARPVRAFFARRGNTTFRHGDVIAVGRPASGQPAGVRYD